PQYSEVSQNLLWIEGQFPVQSVRGAAQRSDGSTPQPPEVAADQNQFPFYHLDQIEPGQRPSNAKSPTRS
ncbi:MAG: hypothetical protein ACRD4C_11995, partial [Candidatus Acidiferrales bacterium]